MSMFLLYVVSSFYPIKWIDYRKQYKPFFHVEKKYIPYDHTTHKKQKSEMKPTLQHMLLCNTYKPHDSVMISSMYSNKNGIPLPIQYKRMIPKNTLL